ncbi:PQQ-binding-like beta-propeller repeat protein [Halalkalicoccus salilacus]|uniref:PQQ-binding-like beta-propeller repeat protein n=1 Tax=Halalkalicoccus sp. GCM10025704 TaxID=3252662 RepID=UPI00361C5931
MWSSPTIADGIVHVVNRAGNVYTLDAAEGTNQGTGEMGEVIYSSPAVVDERLYVGSTDGSVYALS